MRLADSDSVGIVEQGWVVRRPSYDLNQFAPR